MSRRKINGSFLADLLPVTRDRLALLATEIGATSKAPRLPEAVAERHELARTMAQVLRLGARVAILVAGCGKHCSGSL